MLNLDGDGELSWARALAHAATRTEPGYPSARGLPELRAQIAVYLLRRRAVVCEAGNIVIVNGTQQRSRCSPACCSTTAIGSRSRNVVTPSHQFPLGVAMSLPMRRALLEPAARTGAWIAEDES